MFLKDNDTIKIAMNIYYKIIINLNCKQNNNNKSDCGEAKKFF